MGVVRAIVANEAALLDDVVQMPQRHAVRVDRARDALLTDFGRATLDDRYLLPGESYQDLFARVASFYGADAAHDEPYLVLSDHVDRARPDHHKLANSR